MRLFSAKGRNYARITPRGSWLGGWLLGRHSWMLGVEGGQ
jgi:ribosome modulation factor